MCKKFDANKAARQIISRYDDFGTQMNVCWELADKYGFNVDLGKFDLFQMKPKVSYDDWMICLYEADNKFYIIDEECISEVEPISMLKYDKNFVATTFDGVKLTTDEEIFDYCECAFSGEADDMSCYVYFNLVVNEEDLPF